MSWFRLALVSILVSLGAAPLLAQTPPPVKNVIFLLTDGTGPEAWPLARWVKGSPLHVDSILTGAVRTYGADSIITDSAPGSTAYATGFKGSDKGISVGPWHITIDAAHANPALAYVPLATLLEGARLSGRATGLIATSNLQHATPADFSAHWADRNNYQEIGEQQVYQNIDVVLSGGSRFLLPDGVGEGVRSDGENLVEVLKAKGYQWVTTSAEMAAVQKGRLWGAFAPSELAYEIDRMATQPTQPSLAAMTRKAIDLLSTGEANSKKGFFLFVEGSKPDWAAHANDPVGLISDLTAFDEAVGAALDFARRDGNTLVVVVADHGTGGITIGTASDENYSKTDDDSVVGPLRKAKVSAERLETLLKTATTPTAIRQVFADWWGIADLTDAEIAPLSDLIARGKSTATPAAQLLSKRARLGWTTGGHTGADIYLFAYGPGRPTGLVENTAIGQQIAQQLGFDFASLNRRLYVDALKALPALGYNAEINEDDPSNLVLVVTKGSARAELPAAKNQLRIGNQTIELEGLVVSAPNLETIFVPQQAIDLIKAKLK